MKEWAKKILRTIEKAVIWAVGFIIAMMLLFIVWILAGGRGFKGPYGRKVFREFIEEGQKIANRIADSIRNRKKIAENWKKNYAQKRAEIADELETKTMCEYIRDRIRYKYQHVRDTIKECFRIAAIPQEEYEQMVFDKTPPEILIKAQEYEDDLAKLREYLYSLQEQLGFSDIEMRTLCSICHNPTKEQERKEEEKRKT